MPEGHGVPSGAQYACTEASIPPGTEGVNELLMKEWLKQQREITLEMWVGIDSPLALVVVPNE